MKLDTATFPFEFLTDCFSGTAEGKYASSSVLRVPPIRGHVRMWHITAFGAASSNEIWGNTAGDGEGIRVSMKLTIQPPASEQKSEILPHKDNPNHRGPRPALPAGSRATVELTRLPLCDGDQWIKAQSATKLWLLLGTLGLRSARAAGSVWPEGEWAPANENDLKNQLASLGFRHSVRLADASLGNSARELRRAASDTVSGSPQYFGDIKATRKPSPLKMKVVRLGEDLRLLLTGLDDAGMDGARRALGNKDLGRAAWTKL